MTCMSCTTRSATALSLNVTKPKPLGRPVVRSRITTAAAHQQTMLARRTANRLTSRVIERSKALTFYYGTIFSKVLA